MTLSNPIEIRDTEMESFVGDAPTSPCYNFMKESYYHENLKYTFCYSLIERKLLLKIKKTHLYAPTLLYLTLLLPHSKTNTL